MNVFIIVNALPPYVIGGTETQTLEMAKRLSEKHNIVVYARGFEGTPKCERIHGFLVRRAPFIKTRIPLGVFTLSALYELVKRRRETDVVLGMGVYCGFIGVVAKKILGVPVVVAVRGEGGYRDNNAITGFVVGNSDAVWVQSDNVKKEFLSRYPNNRTHVIPNGLDIDGRVAKGNKVIYVGSLHESDKKDKGVKYLIEAMNYLRGYELIVVGDGPQRSHLESMSMGLDVGFVGNVEHSRVKDYLLEAGVFAFPAVYGEGLPNAVLEALSVGLPVVAAKTAKVQGIIRDGETGFLVEPKKPEQMAARIREILENDDLRHKMSENCLQEARKYSWEKVMPQIEGLLEKVALK